MASTTIERYLSECRHRLEVAQVGHYRASSGFRTLHYGIGIPLVVATTLVSASLFSSTGEPLFQIVTSAAAAVLAAVQTFLKPNERAERHRTAATAYGALKRSAEVALAGGSDDLRAVADRLVERWETVAEVSPVTPMWARQRVPDILASDVARPAPLPAAT